MRYRYNVINMIKFLGFIFMVVDHVGYFLFPEQIIFRIIGRVAFPCFLYGIVNGVDFTEHVYRYAGRLLLMGIISVFAWGNVFPLNIGFTLALLIMGLNAYKQENYALVFIFGFLSLFVEYNLYGYLLGLLLYLWNTLQISHTKMIVYVSILHIAIFFIDPIQVFALFFFVIWFFAQHLVSTDIYAPQIPKFIGYSFYPGHVILLRVIQGFM